MSVGLSLESCGRIVLPARRSWEFVLPAEVAGNKTSMEKDSVRCAGKGFGIEGKTGRLKG